MGIGELPPVEDIVKIGSIQFTRKQIRDAYDTKRDDPLIARDLKFGKDCFRAHSCGAMRFIFPDSQMTAIEIAAIMYTDCLPEEHPLKREHSPRDIQDYLAATRLWHFGMIDMPAYVHS